MTAPLLVQYLDLTREHFARHPVWISAHVADDQEPWYGDTDEETFRPWGGTLPLEAESDGLFLVRATFTLADGTVLPGFLTPEPAQPTGFLARLLRPRAKLTGAAGLLQAEVFLPSGRTEQFYDGLIERPISARAALFAELGKSAGAVFPVRVDADPGLTRARATAVFTEF
jgi:hypothetical protein